MKKIKDFAYEEALNKVISVRNQRQKLYGDAWKDDPDWALLAEIRQKYRRLKMQIIDKKGGDYENVEDCLVDLANYCLFMLQNKIDERKK